MKKKPLFYILLSAMFFGCSEGGEQLSTSPENAARRTLSVDFDAYSSRKVTRSGQVGTTTIETLKRTKAQGGGFGVFAYYTDLKQYCQTYVPNFMYNQGVFWKGSDGSLSADYWAYNPVMYWPNEFGSDASSTDVEHLTFFAYAPYVETVSPTAGSVADVSYGIVGFSRNTAVGDPMVRYVASFEPEKSVDLCWGVVPGDKTTWALSQGGSSQTLTEGLPWIDVYRPQETATQAAATSSRVKFKFNHALAQLNVQIDTDADMTTHQDSGDELDADTKVYVRSISFTGIAQQGVLNLNNTVADKALWLDWCGCTDLRFGEKVTVYDGRRDSREGAAGAEAYNETPQGLNPDIIQSSTSTPGVTHKFQNLFKPSSSIADPENPTATELEARLNDAVCVIPTGEAMTVTIVYDIETVNPNLSGYISDGVTHGVSIENRITKTVSFGGVEGAGLESGKRYTLRLHLGLNSVKFDAEVGSWIESTTVEGDTWLPDNGEQQDDDVPITFDPTIEDWDDSQDDVPLPLLN